MFGIEFGIFALIGLVLFIWAVIHIVQSDASPLGKAVWIAVVLFFHIIGFIAWLLFGPKSAKRA